jgi:hypothetical protein
MVVVDRKRTAKGVMGRTTLLACTAMTPPRPASSGRPGSGPLAESGVVARHDVTEAARRAPISLRMLWSIDCCCSIFNACARLLSLNGLWAVFYKFAVALLNHYQSPQRAHG